MRLPKLSTKAKAAWSVVAFVVFDAPQWIDSVVDLAERPSTAPYLKRILDVVTFAARMPSLASSLFIVWSFRLLALAILAFVVISLVRERQTATALERKGLRTELFLEVRHGFMPTTGTDGHIYTISAFPTPAHLGGGLNDNFSATNTFNWTSGSGRPFLAYEFRITNYGDTPVLNIQMALHLLFQLAITTDQRTYQAGAITLARDWAITIATIDVGPNNAFAFYIYNGTTDQFVTIALSETASFNVLTNDTSQTVNIKHNGPKTLMALAPAALTQ